MKVKILKLMKDSFYYSKYYYCVNSYGSHFAKLHIVAAFEQSIEDWLRVVSRTWCLERRRFYPLNGTDTSIANNNSYLCCLLLLDVDLLHALSLIKIDIDL